MEMLVDNNACNQTIAAYLVKWINNNEIDLKDTIFDEAYGILQFKDLNVLNYPISHANHSDIIHSLKNCIHYKDNTETLAMILRDCLEALFFFETDLICTNCGSGGLIVVKEQKLLYECRTCTVLWDLHGNIYTASEPITIPTIQDLNKANGLD